MKTFKTDNITIYNTDNTLLFPLLEDKQFDVSLLDPPYGIGVAKMAYLKEKNTVVVQKNGNKLNPNKNKKIYQQKEWDNEIPNYHYWQQSFRVAKYYLVFGANYFPELVGKPFLPPKRHQFSTFLYEHPTGWIIWDKMNGGNDFNDCELIKTSFNFKSYVLQYMWCGMMQGSRLDGTKQEGNKKLNEKRIHPTQKPTRLYEILLAKHLENGGGIFDAGLGSGSLAEAVQNLNNLFHAQYTLVGCEKETDYFNLLVKRLENKPKQIAIKL